MAVKKATARGRKAAAAKAVAAKEESAVSGEDETEDEQRPQQEENAEGSTAPEERDGSASTPAAAGVLDSVQGEIILLKALAKHRPLGLSRHFEMAALLTLVNGQLVELADNASGGVGGSSDGVEGAEVWEKLRSMWDMERLNGDITPPFPSPPGSSTSAAFRPDEDSAASTTFHLPLTGAFDDLVDARRLHSAASRSPASDPSPDDGGGGPSTAATVTPSAGGGSGATGRGTKRGRELVGDSGSSLTGTEDEDEVADEEEEEEDEEEEESEESEESEEELTPVKKRKRRR